MTSPKAAYAVAVPPSSAATYVPTRSVPCTGKVLLVSGLGGYRMKGYTRPKYSRPGPTTSVGQDGVEVAVTNATLYSALSVVAARAYTFDVKCTNAVGDSKHIETY